MRPCYRAAHQISHRRRGILPATVLLLATVLGHLPGAKAAGADAPSTVVTLGDSITKGVRAGVTAEQTFSTILEGRLKKNGLAVRVINAGIGGETTLGARSRLERDVLTTQPTVVTIMYGTNDSYVDRGGKTSRLTVDAYRENLLALVNALRGRGARPVLMTPPRWADDAEPNGLGESPNLRLEAFVKACRDLAKAEKIPLVDHFEHWTRAVRRGVNLREWTTDGYHPNPRGHAEIAELMLPPILAILAGDGGQALDYQVRVDTVLAHDDGKFLWYHPRAAAIPAADGRDAPAIVMTLQKHLHTSDHYSGLSVMRTDDLGRTWSGPTPRPELDWRRVSDKVTVAVADVTPGWHEPTRRLLAIGAQVRYSNSGEQLEDVARANQTAYTVHDPATGSWSPWTTLAVPDEPRFNFARNACSQWLVQPDGTLLVPLYHGLSADEPYRVSVARCGFDGKTLKVLEIGDELALKVERGLCEPSLVRFRNRYYLTLRNDLKGYVAVSDDGLHFGPIKPWTFDDGSDLGSYNTQQHWLAHSDGLFLVYTRRGAGNDHIIRHRAPLFIGQVDPRTLQVIRKSERVLIPERGAELGNFGASAISANESWVTVAEGVWNDDARKRGARGAVFVARVIWSRPNRSLESGRR